MLGLNSLWALEIKGDGVYVSETQIEVSAEAAYVVSGKITHAGASEEISYIDFGLLPRNAEGEKLVRVLEFIPPFVKDEGGLTQLEALELCKNQSVQIKKRVKFLGGEIRKVSFAIGASLAGGSTITVEDLSIVEESNADTGSDTGAQSSNAGGADGSAALGKGGASGSLSADLASANLNAKNSDDNADASKNWQRHRRLIYVNADIGSDNFQGLKAVRGQADGPKRTLRSAVRSLNDGDEIVLQKSEQPFVVGETIKPKPGEVITIRAEGNATIKGSN